MIAEYPTVLRSAMRGGWMLPLINAHNAPCTVPEATRILWGLSIPGPLRVIWRPGPARGHVNKWKKSEQYVMTLPTTTGTDCGQLRAGLVLHEAAHVLDHQQTGTFGHSEKFWRILRRLVEQNWRQYLKPTGTQLDIYRRHPGACALLMGRTKIGKGGRVEEITDHDPGPYTAEGAHEKARALVADGTYDTVHVFSIREGQFSGAFYKHGVDYPSWKDMRKTAKTVGSEEDGGLELPDERETTALLPGQPEPLQEVDDPVEPGVQTGPVPSSRPVRRVPAEKPAEPRAPRKPRGGPLTLNPERLAEFPTNKGATIVREALAGWSATPGELTNKITPACTAAGIGFPASLISRLKQAGFLIEASV